MEIAKEGIGRRGLARPARPRWHDSDLIAKLAEGGVHTRDELADLAVDELTEMTGLDEERRQGADHEGTRTLVRLTPHFTQQRLSAVAPKETEPNGK